MPPPVHVGMIAIVSERKVFERKEMDSGGEKKEREKKKKKKEEQGQEEKKKESTPGFKTFLPMRCGTRWPGKA